MGGLNNSFEKDFCRDTESPMPLGILFVISIFSIFVISAVLSSLFADGLEEDEDEDEEEDEEDEEEDEEDEGGNCTFSCPFMAFTVWLLKLKY